MEQMFRSPEQANFHQRLLEHMRSGDAPLLLEGTTGLGKTRAYLAAAAEGIASGKKIALVLPTHMLIEQLLNSEDLKVTIPSTQTVVAFLPRRFFETVSDYREHKLRATSADLMLCTSASMIIDQRLKGEYHGGSARDYLIFDEADQLPEAAALQSDCEITAREFADLDLKVESVHQALSALLKKKNLPSELRGRAVLIQEEAQESAWFKTCGVKDDGGIMLYHKMPGRLMKRIANQSNVAFISATLSIGARFDDFKRSMGILAESSLSTSIEPARHGFLNFRVSDLAVDSAEWLTSVMQVIQDAPTPCLVATSSHRLAQQLAGLIVDATVRSEAETASAAAARLNSSQILIAAGAWAGMDTQVRWRSIVVPRIPFERPIVLDDQVESSYLHTRNTAIRRMRQVIGRGLRTPDAVCEVFILDSRFGSVSSFVPKRFFEAWEKKGFLEGQRVELTLSRAERDPSVRKSALRHYGRICMGCGFQPKVDSQLDVHHLNPIASGEERVTTMDDVAVLCANCHRLVHTSKPPLQIARLKELHAAE